MFPDDLSPRPATKWWIVVLIVLGLTVLAGLGFYWKIINVALPPVSQPIVPIKIQTTEERNQSIQEVRTATATIPVSESSKTEIKVVAPRTVPSAAEIQSVKDIPSPYYGKQN